MEICNLLFYQMEKNLNLKCEQKRWGSQQTLHNVFFFFFKVTPQFCKAEFDPDMHKINADLQACFIVQYTFIEYSTLVNFSSEPDLCTRSESTFNLPS